MKQLLLFEQRCPSGKSLGESPSPTVDLPRFGGNSSPRGRPAETRAGARRAETSARRRRGGMDHETYR
jgi:hypothetical protein